MDIHTMMTSAAAEIRTMELRLLALQEDLNHANQEGERLREALAKSDTARMQAAADLIHYQNIFKAQACVEAMRMCEKFFETAHAGMKAEAEAAVERIVADKQAEERRMNEVKEENKSLHQSALTAEQVRSSVTIKHQDDTIIQAPENMSFKEMKLFYKAYLGAVPPNYSQRPMFQYIGNKWEEMLVVGKNHPSYKDDGKPVPSFLTNPEPKEDLRGGVSRVILNAFGG